MTNHTDIVEKLSQFNNMSFTKKQWDIILKGCGCPKSTHFWGALKANNLQKEGRLYTLFDLNNESFNTVWNNYCKSNREGVKKFYYKTQARERARARKTVNVTLYMVDGYLTTEKPTRE